MAEKMQDAMPQGEMPDFETMVKMANWQSLKNGEKIFQELQQDCEHPREVQEDLLFKLLRDNADTPFGKEHGFDQIKTVEDYKRQVPFTTFDDYAGLVYEVMETGAAGVICRDSIIHFNETSGTMGNPKGIPFTEAATKLMMDYGNDYSMYLIGCKYGDLLSSGRKFSMTECRLNTTKGGTTFGAMSSRGVWNYRSILPLMTTSPDPAVFSTNDTDTRYLHARSLLAERNLLYGTTVFVSLYLDLMRYIMDNWQMLVDDIESGQINPDVQLPEEARKELEELYVPMPERAAVLRRIFESDSEDPIMQRIWPNFRIIHSVAGAGFAPYMERMRKYSGDASVLYTGYSASEGIFSVPEKLDSPESILVPRAAYFEFLPLSEDGKEATETVGLEDLEPGHDYEVIVTTLSGFYRYKMRDAIRCVGRHGKAPKMEFLYRLDQTINMKGEKCTEMVLRKAAQRVADRLGLDMVDFSCYPNLAEQPPRYEMLYEFYRMPEGKVTMEELSRVTDEEICAGCAVYGYLRDKDGLAPAKALLLQEETNQLWRDMRVMKGAAPNQIKPVHIIDNEQKRRFFYALIERD